MTGKITYLIVIIMSLLLTACPGGPEDDDIVTILSPSIGTLVYVPGGSFQRDAIEGNVSTVSGFYISQYEITRAQFEDVMDFDPSNTDYSSGVDDPVQDVYWLMAVDFCNRLSEQEDLTPVYTFDNAYDNWSTYGETVTDFSADGYRLPTSSEWQWAAMGAIYGSTYTEGIDTTGWNKSFAGYQDETTIIGDYAVYGYASNYAYDDATPYERTNPVGSKQPNELGLYDMSGNVEEWCHDVFAVYPDGILTDYAGPGPEPAEDYPAMTQQGGSWYDVPIGCTIHNRNHDLTYWPMFFSEGRIGFRVVRR